ncbi:MAG: GtrA family protein [Candidatus Nanosalina sp.]
MFQYGAISLTGLVLENIVLFSVVEFADPEIFRQIASLSGTEFLGDELVLGKLMGAELSIAAMFFLNNRFTFADRPGATVKRFLKSNLVRSGGVLIGLAVLKVVTAIGVWYIFANLLGIAAGFLFNFTMESIYTWAEE